MEIQKSTGIVLSSRQTGEADYLCTLFTKESGKRNFVFKGLQRSKRRPQTVSEPGTSTGIVYYFHEEKSSFIVNEYHIIKHNMDIRNNLKKIYLMYYMLSLIEKTTGFDDANKNIFDLISAGIGSIRKADYIEHFSVFFSLHLLKLHGILPDFGSCKICGKTDYKNFFIDMSDFHPVCASCSHIIKNKTPLLNASIKDYVNQSLENKFYSMNHAAYSSPPMLDFLYQITLFIENHYHVEIKPKSLLLSELENL